MRFIKLTNHDEDNVAGQAIWVHVLRIASIRPAIFGARVSVDGIATFNVTESVDDVQSLIAGALGKATEDVFLEMVITDSDAPAADPL